MHAGADGDPGRSRVAGGHEQLAGSLDRTRRMALAGQERDEHRDELVTHELVDHAVVVEDGRGCRRVEAVEEIAEARAAHPLGERCRAPDVGEQECALDLRASVMTGHEVVARVHHVGLNWERRLPIMRISGAPMPSKGAAHIWHRGPWGTRLKIRRSLRSLGSPFVRNSRQNSSV